MDELLSLIPSLRRALRRRPFTVLIDELDQSWNNTETANRFLVALLIAAIQLRGIDANLHVVVFLRSEIFDLLKPNIAQLDKLRSDIEEIRWSARELTNMIVTRAFYSLGVNPDQSSAEATVNMLFPGTALASGLSNFEYMLSRTSYRPREVIQFCNLALRLAIQREAAEITGEIVTQAEEEFSSWKKEYIAAENLYIYPRLDWLMEIFRGKSRRLSYNALDSILTDILLSNPDVLPKWLADDMEPQVLMDILYKLEIIGVERTNGSSPPGREWEGYDSVFSRPKARTDLSASFLFHPGLWKTLELV